MKEPSILRIIAYISWALNAVLLVGIVMIAIALRGQETIIDSREPMMQGAEFKNALYTYPELTYEAIIMNGPERIDI